MKKRMFLALAVAALLALALYGVVTGAGRG
jgi:hypothetical protein